MHAISVSQAILSKNKTIFYSPFTKTILVIIRLGPVIAFVLKISFPSLLSSRIT